MCADKSQCCRRERCAFARVMRTHPLVLSFPHIRKSTFLVPKCMLNCSFPLNLNQGANISPPGYDCSNEMKFELGSECTKEMSAANIWGNHVLVEGRAFTNLWRACFMCLRNGGGGESHGTEAKQLRGEVQKQSRSKHGRPHWWVTQHQVGTDTNRASCKVRWPGKTFWKAEKLQTSSHMDKNLPDSSLTLLR